MKNLVTLFLVLATTLLCQAQSWQYKELKASPFEEASYHAYSFSTTVSPTTGETPFISVSTNGNQQNLRVSIIRLDYFCSNVDVKFSFSNNPDYIITSREGDYDLISTKSAVNIISVNDPNGNAMSIFTFIDLLREGGELTVRVQDACDYVDHVFSLERSSEHIDKILDRL